MKHSLTELVVRVCYYSMNPHPGSQQRANIVNIEELKNLNEPRAPGAQPSTKTSAELDLEYSRFLIRTKWAHSVNVKPPNTRL